MLDRTDVFLFSDVLVFQCWPHKPAHRSIRFSWILSWWSWDGLFEVVFSLRAPQEVSWRRSLHLVRCLLDPCAIPAPLSHCSSDPSSAADFPRHFLVSEVCRVESVVYDTLAGWRTPVALHSLVMASVVPESPSLECPVQQKHLFPG